ncbi:MAG: hypothetical protein AAFY47_11240, partial [Pseudomonadota bacterium]
TALLAIEFANICGRARFAQRFPQGCLVWREGERPTFLMVEPDNARAFTAMQSGACYGDLIELIAGKDPDEAAIQSAAGRAGAILGQWLSEGLVIALDA